MDHAGVDTVTFDPLVPISLAFETQMLPDQSLDGLEYNVLSVSAQFNPTKVDQQEAD